MHGHHFFAVLRGVLRAGAAVAARTLDQGLALHPARWADGGKRSHGRPWVSARRLLVEQLVHGFTAQVRQGLAHRRETGGTSQYVVIEANDGHPRRHRDATLLEFVRRR